MPLRFNNVSETLNNGNAANLRSTFNWEQVCDPETVNELTQKHLQLWIYVSYSSVFIIKTLNV